LSWIDSEREGGPTHAEVMRVGERLGRKKGKRKKRRLLGG